MSLSLNMYVGHTDGARRWLEQSCSSLLCEQSRKGGKDQETIQSTTTTDPGYHMGK